MSIEERGDMNPEEDLGLRRESEDVEGHGGKNVREAQVRATDDGDDADADDVEAHASKNR
jgi:hypothetical protein